MAQFKSDGLMVQEYVYDFAKDGGAASTIILSNKLNYDPLPVGAIVKHVTAQVVTACTSGGAATVSWGNGSAATAWSGAAKAVASLTLNAVFNEQATPSILWDDTNDASIPIYVSSESVGRFAVTIATAALTAGKIVFSVEYLLPNTVA